jgi:hypothetical protein
MDARKCFSIHAWQYSKGTPETHAMNAMQSLHLRVESSSGMACIADTFGGCTLELSAAIRGVPTLLNDRHATIIMCFP